MITITSLAMLAFAPSTFADSPAYSNWQKTLVDSKTLSADVTVFDISGGQSVYTLKLEKPNKVRLVRGTETIVADGSTVTVFDSKANTFYKKPQTEDELKVILSGDQMKLFAGFFKTTALKPYSTTDGATRSLGGEQVTEINAKFDKTGKTNYTFYAGKDGLVKRAQLEAKSDKGNKRMIFTAKNVMINGSVASDLFAFKAPNGATEVKYEDLISNKWFYDYDEALLVAKQSNRLVFIDFMADWCGPCKMMDRDVFVTDEFKALGKKLVFCKVNIDFNPALAEKYGVEAIPNMFVVKADGTSVGSILGYRPASEFIPELEKLANSSQ
jgi:outer membrane lipoprotein-sorting protein